MGSVAERVTNVAEGKKEYLNLDGLEEKDNFTLFQKCAFDGLQPVSYAHLLPMATELAKKFRGCPLLTKIAGEHLKSNLSDQHWKNLYRQLDHLGGRMDDIITTVLRSSYHHLPANLQLCFRYCSIFPQDFEFNKEELVKMWMASGLIEQETRDERPEDTGECYLMQLTRKSFFTFVPIDDPCGQDGMGHYTMQGLFHDLARAVSLGECLRLLTSGNGNKCDIQTVRHLWIANFNKLTINEIKALSYPKHRMLVIEDSHNVNLYYIEPLEKAVENLKCLRLLMVKNIAWFHFSSSKAANKHLRYLHFKSLSLCWSGPYYYWQKSIIEKLEPHGKLEKLEISAYGGEELPTWIKCVSLTNLVSLELRECVNWLCLPDLGKLEILKHLELEKLTRLRNIGQSSEKTLPPNMTSLVVKGCKDLSMLPVLPLSLVQLKVENVGLTNLPVMSDPHGGEMGFESTPPKLFSVIIIRCSKLRSLEGSFLQQEHCIRGLQILNIVDCENLETAPLLFGKMNDLTGFHIGKSHNLKMMEIKVHGGLLPKTLKQLSIDWCGKLQGPLLDSLLGLTNLTSLRIYHCSMEYLPSARVFKSHTALRIMVVDMCRSLTSLGGLGALSHLTWLQITGCNKLPSVAESGQTYGELSLQVYLLWVDTISLLTLQPLGRLNLLVKLAATGKVVQHQKLDHHFQWQSPC